MKYVEGTSYTMVIAHDGLSEQEKKGVLDLNSTLTQWEEFIPEVLAQQGIGHLPPVERAKATVQFWNETLRFHERPRKLVEVYEITVTKTKIVISGIEDGGE